MWEENWQKKLPESKKVKHSFLTKITPTIHIVLVDDQHYSKQLAKIKPEKPQGQTISGQKT